MYVLGDTVVPSDDAGAKLLNGQAGGVGEVIAYGLCRAVFIAPALYLTGVRGSKILWASLAASAAVTLWGLGYLKASNGK